MPEPGARSEQPGASRFALFDAASDPRYRVLWTAGLCVNTARWMSFVVLGWLVFDMTGSPEWVAVAAFCRNAPMMLVGPIAGIVADRVPRGKLLIVTQCLYLAAASTLAFSFWVGGAQLPILIGLEGLLGIAWAFDFPARRTVLYTVVGRQRLSNAFSLETMSMQGTKIVGPVIAGTLLGLGGALGCYGLMAVFYACSLGLMVLLASRTALPPTGSSESILASLASGIRESRLHPTIMGVLVVTAFANLLAFPYQQLLPVLAREVLHVGPELLGLLVAADGAGALILALAVGSRRGFNRQRELFAGGAICVAVLIIGMATSPWYGLTLAIQFVVGMAECGFGSMQSVLVLLCAPDRARGRVLGILSFCIGMQPLGTLGLGALAGALGPQIAITVFGALGAITIVPASLRYLFRPDTGSATRPMAASASGGH
ncbi:MAG: MFS transporter [Chloroflexota bacterium]